MIVILSDAAVWQGSSQSNRITGDKRCQFTGLKISLAASAGGGATIIDLHPCNICLSCYCTSQHEDL